jgi:tryptophanyl-tRNA synthetase
MGITRPRMLTGDRPTGKLHLGHYVGTLRNRVAYQHDYECYFVIGDLHMLTTRNRPARIRETDGYARELVLDSLAAGIEPEGPPSICSPRSRRSMNCILSCKIWSPSRASSAFPA